MTERLSKPRPPRSRVELANHSDIARELRRLHVQIENGAITAIEGLRQARILSQLGQVLSASLIEARLTKVEKAVGDKKPR